MILSIIIPCYKDENLLFELLVDLNKKINTSDIEIVVSCTHEEYRKIRNLILSKKSRPVKFQIKVVASKKGRAVQMNTGAKVASGEYFWFLHTDSVINNIKLNKIMAFLKKSPSNFLLSFLLNFDSKKLYFRFIEFTSYLRQKFLRLPFGDQGILVPKQIFIKSGGYKEPFEDLYFSYRLKKLNTNNIVWDDKIISSPKRFIRVGIIYTHFIMGLIIIACLLGARKHGIKLYNLIKS